MQKKIYGIDLDQKITPLMVRDALVNCFFEAHCKDIGLNIKEKDANKDYCKRIIVKAFDETGGNFKNPSKEDILNVMNKLAEFSKNFRNSKTIKEHSEEIMTLVEKLD